MTGVPAAQLLNEELMKKKKEDQKRKAIEVYEQFLKKFFNNTNTASNGPTNQASTNEKRRGSKNA